MYQKHYAYFGDKMIEKMSGNRLDKANWEILRNDEKEGPFSIERTIEKYETNCRTAEEYRRAALVIIGLLKNNGLLNNPIVSCGVGKGILEWHLKHECPEINLTCTDYTRDAIEKLKRVFVNLNCAKMFDMINGDYSQFEQGTVIVMYRVSTEFNRKQWDVVFKKMYDANVKYIIYVPTELATLKCMLLERVRHVINRICFRKDVFCGWLYSEDEFLKMFKGSMNEPIYKLIKNVVLGDTAIYYLQRG